MDPHRVNVINTLQLIASPADQVEYQEKVPSVNVATELVNQWFDDFYHPGDGGFEAEFSAAELAAMVEFNEIYDARASQLPCRLKEMLASPSWHEVMAAARKVLQLNNWVHVVARYETSRSTRTCRGKPRQPS